MAAETPPLDIGHYERQLIISIHRLPDWGGARFIREWLAGGVAWRN